MKVLGINSSARKDGNTAILIRTVFNEPNQHGIKTELIQLEGEITEPAQRRLFSFIYSTVRRKNRQICNLTANKKCAKIKL